MPGICQMAGRMRSHPKKRKRVHIEKPLFPAWVSSFSLHVSMLIFLLPEAFQSSPGGPVWVMLGVQLVHQSELPSGGKPGGLGYLAGAFSCACSKRQLICSFPSISSQHAFSAYAIACPILTVSGISKGGRTEKPKEQNGRVRSAKSHCTPAAA